MKRYKLIVKTLFGFTEWLCRHDRSKVESSLEGVFIRLRCEQCGFDATAKTESALEMGWIEEIKPPKIDLQCMVKLSEFEEIYKFVVQFRNITPIPPEMVAVWDRIMARMNDAGKEAGVFDDAGRKIGI